MRKKCSWRRLPLPHPSCVLCHTSLPSALLQISLQHSSDQRLALSIENPSSKHVSDRTLESTLQLVSLRVSIARATAYRVQRPQCLEKQEHDPLGLLFCAFVRESLLQDGIVRLEVREHQRPYPCSVRDDLQSFDSAIVRPERFVGVQKRFETRARDARFQRRGLIAVARYDRRQKRCR